MRGAWTKQNEEQAQRIRARLSGDPGPLRLVQELRKDRPRLWGVRCFWRWARAHVSAERREIIREEINRYVEGEVVAREVGKLKAFVFENGRRAATGGATAKKKCGSSNGRLGHEPGDGQ